MTDEITLDAPETPLERFLAAAAGMDGITLDEPVTRIEKYLYKIAQGSGGVPAVEDADKGKYLHANESTGALEWAEGGSGGGVMTVNSAYDETTEKYVLDKTWNEINNAMRAGTFVFVLTAEEGNVYTAAIAACFEEVGDKYYAAVGEEGTANYTEYIADSASGYPATE